MWGNAKGNSILVNLWNLFTPDIVAASCKPTGTLLRPSIVYLVAGIGFTLGICVAFIGLIFDNLIRTWVEKRKKHLGID